MRQAVTAALNLVAEGASIVDVGAQSSITRREPIPEDREIAAILPVIRGILAHRPDTVISVDTFKASVAHAALDEGAKIINDVSGLRDPRIAQLCAQHRAGLVVMHTAAAPLVRRQEKGLYRNVGAEVGAFLAERRDRAVALGVDRNSILLDPGVDFAKTPVQTIELLQNLEPTVELGHPLLMALSRKDFVGAILGRPPRERLAGTLGAVAALRHLPAQILRVHDVRAIVDMLTVFDTVTGEIAVSTDLMLSEELRHAT